MNIYISQLLIVAGIHALAVISPGPDFLLVSKYSLSYSRKIGIASAVGVALGIGVHITYCILGIGAIIASSVLLFNVIRICGALYLIYLGLSSFRKNEKPDVKKINGDNKSTLQDVEQDIEHATVVKLHKVVTVKSALKAGFLTNVLNPKATLFILAVFTQVIDPATPKWVEAVYGLEMIGATALWFSVVAVSLSTDYFARKIEAAKDVIDKVTGVALTALGLKILLSSK